MASPSPAVTTPVLSASPPASAPPANTLHVSESDQVVLDYCAAIRSILNDDQGEPLRPPGMRMAEGLDKVRDSIRRIQEPKRGVLRPRINRSHCVHRPRPICRAT
jgi:hypothetical protein